MEQRDDMTPEYENEGNRLDTYLQPGEELLISSENIGIKKFLFTACLTNRRLFLVDQKETRAGVMAKEIPKEYIVERYLDVSPGAEPVLALSVRTSDDELRTMKLRFEQSGNDRTCEIEEWMVIFSGGKPDQGNSPRSGPPIAKETPKRPTAPTLVWPAEPPGSPVLQRERIEPAVIPVLREETVKEPGSEGIPVRQSTPAPVSRTPEPSPASRAPAQSAGARTGEIQYCHHCGKKIPLMANFCPFCGTKAHDPERITDGNPAPRPVAPIQASRSGEPPERRSLWKRLWGKK
ncbi:MAG: zinc-ribbon domain-containing protein [Methanoregulaceae archaeon]|nr:zinc-ribbon domain-containing protein [Methanoregulaceae archaeon]